MSVLSGSSQTNQAPTNTDWQITVNAGNYPCGSTVQRFDLSGATMTAGRWAIVRVLKSAGSITDYVGATVTQAPAGLSVYSISREDVSYSGTTYDCIVVTLV
jgi:hypothetical protein